MQKNRPGAFELSQLIGGGRQTPRKRPIQGKAVFRSARGQKQVLLERKLPAASQRVVVSCQCAWHSRGQSARLAEPCVGFAFAQKHVARGSCGRGFPPVDGHERAVRFPQQHETAATDAGIVAIDYAEHQRRRHRRVNGVAPSLQGGDARLGREWLHGRHHPMPALGRGGQAGCARWKAEKRDEQRPANERRAGRAR